MVRIYAVLGLLMLAISASGSAYAKPPMRGTLVVGWHDEMNSPSLWKPLASENPPDVYAARSGLLTLRLPHVPDGYPYTYQWSGASRTISADLVHYPVLVAYVSSLDAGSYAHLDVEERNFSGHVTHSWRSPTLTHPGVTSIDLGQVLGPSVRRLTLRLIVGGKLTGAKCEYNWVRLVHHQDAALLKKVPNWQNITSREP